MYKGAHKNVRVSIPFKREGVSKEHISSSSYCFRDNWFQFPSNGKVYPKLKGEIPKEGLILDRFNSLQTGRCIQRDPILSPVGPWLQNAKTKHEVHTPIFMSKFSPKIPQTHVAIDPNTIFYQKRLGTQTPRAFLGNLRGIGIRLPNRVCCVCVDILSIP